MPRPGNPFSISHWTPQTVAYWMKEGEWEALMGRLEETGCRLWLVGPRGAGKSTLLESLARRLEARGRVCRRVRARWEWRTWLDVTMTAAVCRGGQVVFLDSAECLPGWLLAGVEGWLVWRGAGLVATVHRERKRPGRAMTISVGCTGAVLEQVLSREFARLGWSLPAGLDAARLDVLLRQSDGNGRAVLETLYREWDRRGGLYDGTTTGDGRGSKMNG